MAVHDPSSPKANGPFKLLLFIDKRPNSTEQVRRIRQKIKEFRGSEQIDLEIVDVSDQPFLAEHFKLVATPALIKVSANTHQVVAGTDIAKQLEAWWPRWQKEIDKKSSQMATLGIDPWVDPGVDPGVEIGERLKVDAVAQSTEILKLSDEIFRLNQEKTALSTQLAFKDRIIAMMAHDLRNPLTAASIALETLELAFEPNGERVEKFTPELVTHLLKSTKSQIRTINSMIVEILEAARGPGSTLTITPEKFDFKALCTEVLGSLQTKVETKKQMIEVDIPQDLPLVYADSDQVQRVLSNLIDNAIKYTPVGGRIGVAALHRTTEKVQISIRDNGPGIPLDKQSSIFEENFRLKRDQMQEGYGLGLALCQRIIRAHYGQIWVDSKRGEGSCFHFTLPVYRG